MPRSNVAKKPSGTNRGGSAAFRNSVKLFFKNEIVRLGSILLIITLVVALLLGGVNELTKDTIKQLAEEKFNQSMQTIFPDSSFEELSVEPSGSVTQVYEAFSGGTHLGYIIRLAPTGFGGALDLLAGVDESGTIAGISVISHSETPGLGSRVTDEEFTAQFPGRTSGIELIKNQEPSGNQVQALSGATISSNVVLDAINEALDVAAGLEKGGA